MHSKMHFLFSCNWTIIWWSDCHRVHQTISTLDSWWFVVCRWLGPLCGGSDCVCVFWKVFILKMIHAIAQSLHFRCCFWGQLPQMYCTLSFFPTSARTFRPIWRLKLNRPQHNNESVFIILVVRFVKFELFVAHFRALINSIQFCW